MENRQLTRVDPQIDELIRREEARQRNGIELIASENYVSRAVMDAMGTVLNNRYSEGYPGARYYGGQEVMDEVETLAIDRAKAIFGAVHANVQPHAGAPANLATYLALADIGSTILGMDLSHGGHLTHGHPVTHAAKMFKFVRYKMKDVETGEIDYDELRQTALEHRPAIVLAGFSAYPRELDYRRIREIASEVDAFAVADVAHIAGMIVGGHLRNPLDDGFDVVLTTTHKSLRGPRGGLILSANREIAQKIDKSVFPGFQGGPIMQMVAAKAVAFHEAQQPAFKDYSRQILANAKTLAAALQELGAKLITNGTDNHLMLVDCVSSWGLSGEEMQERLDRVGITLNKNMIPDDPRSARDPSGVRIGTPAMTTRGFADREMHTLASLIDETARCASDSGLEDIEKRVRELAEAFPVPGLA